MPVIVLAGDEEFEISRRVADLKASLVDPSWLCMNFMRLENPDLAEIVDAAASLPFGPGNRLVLIDQCELFTKKRGKGTALDDAKGVGGAKAASKRTKEEHVVGSEALISALASIYERTYVIFACPYNFDSTLKISKVVSTCAQIETFAKEKFWPGSKNTKLETWCRKESKRFGATIDDEAIEYLLSGADVELRQISAELEKAAVANLPGTHITLDLLVKLSPHQSHVFAFADHWLNNRLSEALLCLDELLAQQSAMPIFAAVNTMLSKWIKIKILADDANQSLPSLPAGRKELPLPELVKRVAQEMKLAPFIVEKDLRRLSKHKSEELIEKRIELTRLEYLVKSGQIPDKHALSLFVLK